MIRWSEKKVIIKLLMIFFIIISWYFFLLIYYIVKLSPLVIEEFKHIIAESEIIREDDNNWPEPDKVGRQELEIKIDNQHISFTVFIYNILINGCFQCVFNFNVIEL